MPRYDYECQTCFHEFEVKQSFSSEPVATCPNCMNSARRVIRAVPVVFKGSGFYVNDYGKGKSAGSAQKPADSDSDKSTGEKSTGDKPAAEKPAGEKASENSKGGSKKEPVSTK